MTVKSLSAADKNTICSTYTQKMMTVSELAIWHATSARTIGRVLEERGLATPVPRLQGDAYQVMQLLKKHNLTPVTLAEMLEAAPLVPQIQDVPALLDKLTFSDLLRNFNTSAMKKLIETHPGTPLETRPITQLSTSQTAITTL